MSNNQEEQYEIISGTNLVSAPEHQNHLLENTLVSYSPLVTQATNVSRKPLADVLNLIKTSEILREKIGAVRLLSDDDKARQDLKNETLPWFSFVEYHNAHRKNTNLKNADFLLLDIDHWVGNLDDLKGKLRKDDTVFFCFVSPSGDGLKFSIRLDQTVTSVETYRAAYKHYMVLYGMKYGFEPDTTHDPARACYFSYDPDLYVNENCTPVPAIVPETELTQPPKPRKSIADKLGPQKPGNRIPTLASMIGTFINRGFSEKEVLALTQNWNLSNEPPKDEDEIQKTVTDMYARYESGRYDHYWSYQSEIFEFGIRGEEFFMNTVGARKVYTFLNAHTKEERDRVFNYVVKNKHIPHIKRVNHIGGIGTSASFYDVHTDAGEIDVHYAAIPESVQDNLYVEDYLERLFGTYKHFIKEWLAVYVYTNYRKLPTLVLIGARGTGKNTFAEFIGEIYKPLSQMWHGDERNFSPEVEKKLLIADETVSEDPEQYKTLKKYSGEKYAMVNKKYQPPYEVVNNMNIVILSNGKTPIFVEREEVPTSESNNQFFVYEFPLLTVAPDADIATRLTERLGHYIRTELKDVYEKLNTSGNRYSIKVPITDIEKALFANNASDVELEADRIVEKIVDKMNDDSLTFEHKSFIAEGYLPSDFVDWFYDAPNRKMRNRALKNMKERGFISGDRERKEVEKKRKYVYSMTDKLKSVIQGG